jgi:hypothetical protein
MAFRNAHVSLVSFAIDITPAGATNVMVVETDLHLNPRHAAYSEGAVQQLTAAAQGYLVANVGQVTHIRLVSSRSGEL